MLISRINNFLIRCGSMFTFSGKKTRERFASEMFIFIYAYERELKVLNHKRLHPAITTRAHDVMEQSWGNGRLSSRKAFSRWCSTFSRICMLPDSSSSLFMDFIFIVNSMSLLQNKKTFRTLVIAVFLPRTCYYREHSTVLCCYLLLITQSFWLTPTTDQTCELCNLIELFLVFFI